MFEIRLGQVQEQLQEFSAKVLFMFSKVFPDVI